METEKIQLKTLFAATALILVIEAIYAAARTSDALNLPVIGIIRLVEIVCLPAIVFLTEKNISCIGLYRSGILAALKRGVLWSIGFGLLAAIAALVLVGFGIHPQHLIRVQLPSDTSSLLLFFLVGGIVGPVAEEIFFRGLIFRFFRRWGFLFSLCFSTLIFAAMHATASGVPVTQVVGGLLFAASFEIEKNLLAPTVIHVLGNLSIFLFSLIFY